MKTSTKREPPPLPRGFNPRIGYDASVHGTEARRAGGAHAAGAGRSACAGRPAAEPRHAGRASEPHARRAEAVAPALAAAAQRGGDPTTCG